MSRVTVWYDSQCPLCRREIELMKRLDTRGAIVFIDLETATFCPLGRDELLARFHADEDGSLYSGAAAFGAMWRHIPLLKPLGLAARNRHVLALLERTYSVFLKFRPRMQRFAQWLEGRSS